MTNPKRLVIVQPYVPLYRVQFFESLIQVLAMEGITCVVAASEPSREQRGRGDAADAEWIVRYRARSIALGGRSLTLGGSYKAWRDADAVIVGHLGSSVDTYRALLGAVRGPRRAAVWGHIKSYVAKPHPVDAQLERWQLTLADHVFAYTPGGGEYARQNGVPSSKLSVVMNATDTTALQHEIDALTDTQVAEFGLRHRLVDGEVVAFIGALDRSKRIDFLASVLDHLWELRPQLRVVLGGAGDQHALLERAIHRGQVIDLGYADDLKKALIGRWSSALVMPGRIGLVAVESMMLKMPVITTPWPYHAPEAEYLAPGISKFDAPNDPIGYAEFVARFMDSSHRQIPDGYPTIDSMVENFRQGVLKLLA